MASSGMPENPDMDYMEKLVWRIRYFANAMAAIDKMEDEGELLRLVTKHPNWDVRDAAAKTLQRMRISDPAVILRSYEQYWDSANEEGTIAAVLHMDYDKNHIELTSIATKHPNWNVRKAACDQLRINTIKMVDFISNMSLEIEKLFIHAVRFIENQDFLFYVARTHNSDKVRYKATRRIKSQEMLTEIAKNDEDWQIRDYATGKITDKGTLREIMEIDDSWQVREMAEARLNDTDPPPHDENHPMAFLWEDPW